MTRVVFVLTPRLHLLDLAGPAQVFGTAADAGHPYELGYVADDPVVPTHQGVTLQARTDWPELTAEDMTKLRQFAGCMREKGFPNYPDPDAQGNFPLPDDLRAPLVRLFGESAIASLEGRPPAP